MEQQRTEVIPLGEDATDRRGFLKQAAAAGAALSVIASPAAFAATRKAKVYTGKRLDRFNWSFAIPVSTSRPSASRSSPKANEGCSASATSRHECSRICPPTR